MRLRFEVDTDVPDTPRDWDNLGVMVAFHSRYTLGDKTDLRTSMFEGWDDLKEHLIKEEGAVVILPLYFMDHGSVAISTSPFGCPWDSGQVGFIYTTRKKIFGDNPGLKRLTRKRREKAEEVLRAEVTIYNQYLSGDIWGYIIEEDDGTQVDSCWGFYGYDTVKEEGEEALRILQGALYEEYMQEKGLKRIVA